MKKIFPWMYIALPALMLLSGVSSAVKADVTVTLDEPDWHFVLKQHATARNKRMSRDESEFIRTIQPLLEQQNYSAAIAQWSKFDNDSVSPALYELMGQVFVSEQQFDKAETVLLKALAEAPGMGMAHRSLSMVYLMEEDFNRARVHLVKNIESGITDAQLYGQLGYINLQLEKPASAVQAYQSALMLEPENSQWSQGLLFALIGSNALEQASALLSEMIIAEPANIRLWVQRSQIAMRLEDDNTAIASLETAMSMGEAKAGNITSLARLHVRSGSPERAVELLSDHANSLLADKNVGPQTFMTISNWLVASQDWVNLTKLVKSLEKHKQELSSRQLASVKVFKANIAQAENAERQARQYLTEAIKMAPDNGEALVTLAGLHSKARNDERANMYYLRAETLPDYRERALLGRAQVAINQNAYADALNLLRKVYRSNPARTELLGNIRSLENLVQNAS